MTPPDLSDPGCQSIAISRCASRTTAGDSPAESEPQDRAVVRCRFPVDAGVRHAPIVGHEAAESLAEGVRVYDRCDAQEDVVYAALMGEQGAKSLAGGCDVCVVGYMPMRCFLRDASVGVFCGHVGQPQRGSC